MTIKRRRAWPSPEARATPPRRSSLAGGGFEREEQEKDAPTSVSGPRPDVREEAAALSSTRDAARRGARSPFWGCRPCALPWFFFHYDDGAIQGFSNFAAHARVLPTSFFFTRRSFVRPLCLGEHNLPAWAKARGTDICIRPLSWLPQKERRLLDTPSPLRMRSRMHCALQQDL